MSSQLPPRPHLDVIKKQARQLLNDHQSGVSEALVRVQAVVDDLPRSATGSCTLRQAQQVIAREYGFSSWQALLDHVSAARGVESPQVGIPSFYNKLATDLVTARVAGHLQTFGRVGEDFDRRMVETASAGEDAGLALEQARLAVAAQSDCGSWDALAQTIADRPQPGLVTLEQLRATEDLHEALARQLGDRFSDVEGVEGEVKAEIAFVDRTSYGEFVVSLATPSCAYRCSMEGLDQDLSFVMGPLLEQALVAPDQDGRDVRLAAIAQGIVEDLVQLWQPVTSLRSTGIVPYADPFSMTIAPMYEICVLLAFTMTAAPETEGLPGVAEVCYPAKAIAGFLDDVVDLTKTA